MNGNMERGDGIAAQIRHLATLTGLDGVAFRHQLIGNSFAETDGTSPHSILAYDVPPDLCLIICAINLATIPGINDPALTMGDWRSSYYDASGDARLWLAVNETPKTTVLCSAYTLLNQPVLFVIGAGQRLNLMAERAPGAAPPGEQVLIAVSCYLAPASAADVLAPNETNVVAASA